MQVLIIITSSLGFVRSIAITVYVCLYDDMFVCLSARIAQKAHVQA